MTHVKKNNVKFLFLFSLLIVSSTSSSSSSSSGMLVPCQDEIFPSTSDLSARLLDRILVNAKVSSSSSLTFDALLEATLHFSDSPSGNFTSIRRCINDDQIAAAAAAAAEAAAPSSSSASSFSLDANRTACLMLACGRLSKADEVVHEGVEREEDVVADAVADPTKLSALLRGLLLDALTGRCSGEKVLLDMLPKKDGGREGGGSRVPWQKSVAYGSGFAATVVIGSQFGGLLYPLRNHIAYKICLT